MGGNAFTNTRRLSEAAYRDVCRKVAEALSALNGVHCRFPPEVEDKASIVQELKGLSEPYGDVDVIVSIGDDCELNEASVTRAVIDAVNGDADTIRVNGKTHSILSGNSYQIDLLYCPLSRLDFLAAVKGNNDFLAFFGHVLRKYGLKMTPDGFILSLPVEINTSSQTRELRKAQIFLTNDLESICTFLGIPRHCLDGRTRLSTKECFSVLARSYVYFHRDEFSGGYRAREARKGRATIERMFQHMAEYDGGYEEQKNEENPTRLAFRAFVEGGEQKSLEEYILDYFDKTSAAAAEVERLRSEQRRSAFKFGRLRELLPELSLEEPREAARVMAALRRELGTRRGRPDLDLWFEGKTDVEVRDIVLTVLRNSGEDGGSR